MPKKISFPYWSLSLPSPNTMFEKLKTQELNITTDKNGNPVLNRIYPYDYLVCDHLSNHFTEKIRISCRFADKPTPEEVWEKIKDTDEFKKLNNNVEKREFIYNATKECNTFNVTFCLWLINSLVGSNKYILDPSSGWGDRMIASIASEAAAYHGYDPNTKLRSGYKKIEQTFPSNTEIQIKYIPFEKAKITLNYDLAITSPPYFNLEKYSTDNTQSIVKYPTYNEWLYNFYYPYIMKLIDSVKSDGYIVIYIENIRSDNVEYKLRDATIEIVNRTNSVKNHTQYGLQIGRNIRYALVWQKK